MEKVERFKYKWKSKKGFVGYCDCSREEMQEQLIDEIISFEETIKEDSER